jgi:RNA polymerase sigma factor (sigma-70 family)
VNSQTDQQLLRDYAERRSEEAFAELVRRNVDFVFSVALRMVRDPHLAKDVTQGVFVALAGNARRLIGHAVLAGWLHRTTRNIAAQSIRSDVRRRAREKEAAAMNELLSADRNPVWDQVAPQLDTALGDLKEVDRDALLLRYFQGKSARQIGQVLGVSDEAAQKRVSRAVEMLRESFAKRGVTVGAGGLVAVISANAVQSAPIGLSASITATTLAGTTFAASTTLTLTKALAMTTLQKAIIFTAIAAAVGTGIYQTQRASGLRAQLQAQQEQQAPLAEQIQTLQQERDEAKNRLDLLAEENSRWKPGSPDPLKRSDATDRSNSSQTASQMAAEVPNSSNVTFTNNQPVQSNLGRELGEAVVRGDRKAFEQLLELSKSENASFRTNMIGLNDTQRSQLSTQVYAPLHEAFRVITEAAAKSDAKALSAIGEMIKFPEVRGMALHSLGALAGNGNNEALEILLNPLQYGFPRSYLSSAAGALVPAARNGNEKAIDGLAAVAKDSSQQAMWYMVADGLNQAAAEAGNTVAVDALIGMAGATNRNTINAVVAGLKKAAANQNQKAAAALLSMGVQ